MADTPAVKRLISARSIRSYVASLKPDESQRQALAGRDDAGLETTIMERIEKAPEDIGFFIAMFGLLAKRKRLDTAEVVYQFLLEPLKKKSDAALLFTLYSSVLVHWPENRDARNGVCAALKSTYPDSANADHFADYCKIMDADEPLEAFEHMENWLMYDTGTGVFSEVGGVGRVTEASTAFDTIRVTFEGKAKPVSFKLGEAHKILERLRKNHVLLMKLDDPAALSAMADTVPAELLGRLFSDMGRTLTLSEIKQMLCGAVPAEKWTSWWTKARKDPRLTMDTDGVKGLCAWNDNAGDADDKLAGEFSNADPRRKIELAQKYGARSARLGAVMARGLTELCAINAASDPALALEAFLMLEKMKNTSARQTGGSILARADAALLIGSIGDKTLRRQAVGLLPGMRADWVAVYADLIMREDDFQIIGTLYDALTLGPSAGMLAALVGKSLDNPPLAPRFFLWLVRELPQREELKNRAGMDLLHSIVSVFGKEELKAFHAQARTAFDPGGAVDRCIEKIDAEQAAHFIVTLDRIPTLERYRKDQTLDYIYRCQPQLRQKAGAADSFFATKESIEARRLEFERLVKVEIPQNTQELQRAKAHGDLRENFEYKAARAKQELLFSQVKTLYDQLASVKALDPSTVDTSKMYVGTRVLLAPDGHGGDPVVLTLLGPWESDPSRTILSYTARAAEPMIGKAVGAAVMFNEKQYIVSKIVKWTDAFDAAV